MNIQPLIAVQRLAEEIRDIEAALSEHESRRIDQVQVMVVNGNSAFGKIYLPITSMLIDMLIDRKIDLQSEIAKILEQGGFMHHNPEKEA